MKTDWISLSGKVVRGHRVASGPSMDYPYGTIEKQRPIFKSLGLDLGDCFSGTLNIDIRPHAFAMRKPQYTFEQVAWTDLHPPETFSFSRCRVIYRGQSYDGWVYYPHPETKRQHFQNESLLEVIAQRIPGIRYGEDVEVWVNGREIDVG